MSITELLTKVSLFKGMKEDDLQRLAEAMEPATFATDEVIVEVGDPGRSLFIILEGAVQVVYPARHSDFELARLGPGDFFGEMALLNDKPRSATVRAKTRVRTLRLDKETFHRLILQAPLAGIQIMEVLSLRIRAADEQISGLSDQAQRDTLTGLLTRRAFQERLAEECDRFQRYGHAFSVVLLDLDRFRDVNETFGYDAGDTAISWVARLLTEHTREADVPFRLGGGEFGLLCPCTPVGSARNVAERLVGLVSLARPPVSFELKVTLSAGLAGCPDHGRLPEELYWIAHRALVRAKGEGRGSVRSAGAPAV